MKQLEEFSITNFHKKILEIETPGKNPESVMIVIPSIIELGEEYEVSISLLDKDKFPCFQINEVLTLVDVENETQKVNLDFSHQDLAVVKVKCMTTREGFIKYYVVLNGQKFYSNPALVKKEKKFDMLWGDPHIHTTVGDCHPTRGRTRNLAYTVARYVYHLDWVAIADHVSWGKRGTLGKWRDNIFCADLFNDKDRFTALYAYETSMRGGDGGDVNIYFKDAPKNYIDPWPDELNIKTLCDKLDENKSEYLAIPHHTTRVGKHGEIGRDIYPGEKCMPVMEIHSKWGTSEFRGNPTPLMEVHEGPSYAVDLLNNGIETGFVGGTDTHSSLTFNKTLEQNQLHSMPGLTCVLSYGNSRESIFDAIKERMCYAGCEERNYIEVTANDTIFMGKALKINRNTAPPVLNIQCATSSDITSLEIIRNGCVVFRKDYGSAEWFTSIEWKDDTQWINSCIKGKIKKEPFIYYYVRVTSKSYARLWSSPIWFYIED